MTAFTNQLPFSIAPAFFQPFSSPTSATCSLPNTDLLLFCISCLKKSVCLHFPNLIISQECSSNRAAVNELKRSFQRAVKQEAQHHEHWGAYVVLSIKSGQWSCSAVALQDWISLCVWNVLHMLQFNKFLHEKEEVVACMEADDTDVKM